MPKTGAYCLFTKMRAAESLSEELVYDSRLIKTKACHYYLCVPKPVEIRSENQAPVFSEVQKSMGASIVALNPGVGTFQTCFDLSGLIAGWDINSKARLGRLFHAYDNVQSRWCQKEVNHYKRYEMKKANRRIQERYTI
jgi:hypothetical protein